MIPWSKCKARNNPQGIIEEVSASTFTDTYREYVDERRDGDERKG